MNEKKIEPTQAMVDIVDLADKLMVMDTRDLLRTALNHPDAAGLFADEDDRPWEPLGESDPARVGDEVKWDYYGLTMTATVARVDKTGSLYTAAGLHIGVRSVGTWHVRRVAPELPTEDGAVIVPADGHEYIETNEGVASALVHLGGKWYGGAFQINSEQIIPGTWKVDGK